MTNQDHIPAMQTSNHPDPKAREAFNKLYAERARREAERPKIEEEGIAALVRLFDIANGSSGQCKTVAKFLLGCYNGLRFPFDLTDFRSLDWEIFNDCMAVLKMDSQPRKEIHLFFQDGGKKFEQLAADWQIPDQLKDREELEAYRRNG